LVPQAFFDPEHLANYLKFNAKIYPTDHLDFDRVEGLESANVYVPFTNVNNYIYELFGEFEFKHSATVLLETLLTLPSSGQGTICYVHMAEEQMDMAVLDNRKLLFFNSFPYTSPTDFIYYLLFSLEQLGKNLPIRRSDKFKEILDDQDPRYFMHPKKDQADLDPGFQPEAYHQVFSDRLGFQSNLSILDLIFNMGPDALSYLKRSLKT
jgi:hypothetical protein